MKTNLAVFTVSLALSGLLLTVQARAAAGVARNAYSEGSRGSTNVATSPNSQQTKSNASTAKPAGTNIGNHNLADGKAKEVPLNNSISLAAANKASTVGEKNPACKLNPEKATGLDLNKNCGGFDCNNGLKFECFPDKVCWPRGDLDCGLRDYWENGRRDGWRRHNSAPGRGTTRGPPSFTANTIFSTIPPATWRCPTTPLFRYPP